MKLEQTQHNIESTGVLNEAFFGISLNDQSHILSILRDKLYSDKILAVVREYCANAVDAHIDAGKSDLPIKVTLPDRLTPHFIVRDYGIGLTENEIFKLYIQYGASTKRASNDAIGQLGLGCKAAFAYTDSFTVTSWIDNTKSVYHAFIDETDIGKIVKLSVEPSDEKAGIEIKLAVKDQDYNVFTERATRLFKYFDVQPETNKHIPKLEHGISGTFWWIPKGDNYYSTPMAIMGNIPYPIAWQQITPHLSEMGLDQRILSNAIQAKPVLKFKIGDLSISASREALEYTDKTIGSIKIALLRFVSELKTIFATAINKAKTIFEARKLYANLSNELNYYLRTLLSSTWNNIDLKDGVLIDSSYHKHFRYLTRGEHSSDDSHMRWRNNNILANGSIIINDVSTAWCTRAKQLIADKKLRYIAAYTPSDLDKQAAMAEVQVFLKRHQLEGMDVYYLSDIDYQSQRNTRQGAGKRKQTTTVFKLVTPTTNIVSYRAMSYDDHKYWEPVEVNLKHDSGVYIALSHYRSVNSNHSNRKLLQISQQLQNLQAHPGEIYGIKKALVKSRVEKLQNWTSFDDHIQQIPQAYYKKYKSRINFVEAYLKLVSDLGWSRWTIKVTSHFQTPPNNKHSLLLRLLHFTSHTGRKIIRNGKTHYHTLAQLEQDFGTHITREEVTSLITYDDIQQKYPLFRYVEFSKDTLIELTDYILLVDKTETHDEVDTTTPDDQNRQHVVCDPQPPDICYRFKPYELEAGDDSN